MTLNNLNVCILCGRTFMPHRLYPDVGLLCDDSDGCRRAAVRGSERVYGVPLGVTLFAEYTKERNGVRPEQS